MMTIASSPCLVALAGLLAFRAAPAMYVPLEPFELALQADLIVDGVIIQFDAPRAWADSDSKDQPTFKIRVVEVIAGQADSPGLVISEFKDWDCASRYAPYELGQRAVFFLELERNEDGSINQGRPWSCMGAGNEGECPVVGESVIQRGIGLKELSRDTVEAFGHPFSGVVSPRVEFVETVRCLRSCFEWRAGPPKKRVADYREAVLRLRQTCTNAELEAFMGSSELARAMVQDSNAYRDLRIRETAEQSK